VAFARIERETPPKGFEILYGEGFPFLLSKELFIQESLHLGQELTEKEFLYLKELQEHHLCSEQAMRYLANREHTRFELLQKLSRKGFDRETATGVLDRLAEQNLLSEYRYARLFIQGRLRKRPEGRLLMRDRLAAKQVNRQEADKALDEFYDEQSTRTYVRRAYHIALAKVGEEKARLYLRKMGFTPSEIRMALDEYGPDE
jgi:regulatory protein